MLSVTASGRFPIKAETFRKNVVDISSKPEKKIPKKGISCETIQPAETNINNPDKGTAKRLANKK